MIFVLAIGTTHTARIPGISAAGADPTMIDHTPRADAEILEYGQPVSTARTPVSPSGCPTPAVVTRAVREVLGFKTLIVNAGIETDTAAPTRPIGEGPGRDIREPEPVPGAPSIFASARELGATIPDAELIIAESIPGGTTTALGVLTALGEPHTVSSSLKTNPLERKQTLVATALAASGLDSGELRGTPIEAIRRMGDPVLAAVSGLAIGALETDRTVILAGGTQMIACAAVLRHHGITNPIRIATTSFVASDESTDIVTAAAALDVSITVTDPEFQTVDHPVMNQYQRGEAKEGVGMGGALMLADRSDTPLSTIHDRIITRYNSLASDDGS